MIAGIGSSRRGNDDKIVSITFDNKQFLKDVQETIDALDALNDVTSGKKLKTDGLDDLAQSFSKLNKSAKDDINDINKSVEDTSSYGILSKSIEAINSNFDTLKMIGTGALLEIGELAVTTGLKLANVMTGGIRSGWAEYNMMMDSTQTILTNTEKYGTTIDDVTAALDELNDYADKTIYNFAQMTQNIGRFTTAGMSLEDSVTAVQGLSNVGALFGVNAQKVANATYQISQAMASGVIQLRDWMSVENSTMGGEIFQDELIRTAAQMSNRTYEEMYEWVHSFGAFRDSLRHKWLTTDVMIETLRKFAGESREFWEALTDAQGNQLLPDEEIDRIMRLGETAFNSATEVKTLSQMLEALGEAIGSGWQESFRIIIGDLEEAKAFWTPINNMLSTMISGIGNFRNQVLQIWADSYRQVTIDKIIYGLEGINDLLGAIGRGFSMAFGSPRAIALKLGRFIDAITDLAVTLRLSEDELEDVSAIVSALLSPFKIFGEIVYEIARVFFNANDALNEFGSSGESLVDIFIPARKSFLETLGNVSRIITATVEWAKKSGIIHDLVLAYAEVISRLYSEFLDFMDWLMPKLRSLANDYLIPLAGIFVELGGVSISWIRDLGFELGNMDIHIFRDLLDIFSALKDVFIAIHNPAIDVTDAFNNFRNVFANTSIAQIIDKIKESFSNFIEAFKNTRLFTVFTEYLERFKNTTIGGYIYDMFVLIGSGIRTFVGYLQSIDWNGGIFQILESIMDAVILPLAHRISDLNLAEKAIEILKTVASTLFSVLIGIIGDVSTNFRALEFDFDIKEALTNILLFLRSVMLVATLFSAVNIPTLFAEGVTNIVDKFLKPANELVSAIKQKFKVEQWEVMGKFFKDLALFVGVLTASIMLLASIKDPYLALPLLITILGGICLILTVMNSSFTQLFGSVKRISDISFGKGLFVFMVLTSVIGFMKQIFTFILSISVLTYLFSKLEAEQKQSIILGFTMVMAMFLIISSMMYLLLDRIIDSSRTFDNQFNNINRVISAYRTVSNTLLITLLLITFMMNSLIKRSSGDPLTMLSAAASFILVLMAFTLMTEEFVVFAKILDKDAGDLKSMSKVKSFLVAFGIISVLMMGSISKLIKNSSGDPLTMLSAAVSFGLMLIAFTLMAEKLIAFSKVTIDKTTKLGKIETFMVIFSMVSVSILNAISTLVKKSNGDVFSMLTATTSFILVLMAMTVLTEHLLKFATTIEAVNGWTLAKIENFITYLGTLGILIGITINEILKSNSDPIKVLTASIALILVLTALTGLALATAKVSESLNTVKTSSILKMAVTMGIILASTMVFLYELQKLANIVKVVGTKTVLIAAATLGGIAIGLIAILSVLSLLEKCKIIDANKIIIIAGAMLALSLAIQPIGDAIFRISATDNIDTYSAIKAATAIAIVLGSMAVVLGGLSAVMKKLQGGIINILVIAAVIPVLAYSLIFIADALKSLSGVENIWRSTGAILAIFGVLSIIMGVLAAIGGGTGGLGIVAILAAAGALVLLASSVVVLGDGIARMGLGMEAAANGVKTFVDAMKLLEEIDGDRLERNMRVVAQFVPIMAQNISQNKTVIKEAIRTIFIAIGEGIAGAINVIFGTVSSLIVTNFRYNMTIVMGLLVELFRVIMETVAQCLDILADFLTAACGPGGSIRRLVTILADFLLWAAGFLVAYGFEIGIKIISGIADALGDEGVITRLINAIKMLIINTKLALYRYLGAASLKEWAAKLATDLVQSFINSILTKLGLGLMEVKSLMEQLGLEAGLVSDLAEGLVHLQVDMNQAVDGAQDRYLAGQISSLEAARRAIESENEALEENAEARLDRQRAIEAEGDTSHYDPSRYYAAQAGVDDWDNGFTNQNGSVLDGLISTLTGGRSISEIFGEGSGGLSGLFSMFTGASEENGEDAGNSWLSGFGDSLGGSSLDALQGTLPSTETSLTNISETDFSNLDGLQNLDSVNDVDWSNFSYGVENAGQQMDDISSPVITPVIDDSEFNLGLDRMDGAWNSHRFDELAVDIGNSMLVREQAEGDAATNGDVTYNFTQINNSPEALSPIQIYRDTRNLIRARIN